MDGYGRLEWRDKSESPFSSTSQCSIQYIVAHATHITMRTARCSFIPCSAFIQRRPRPTDRLPLCPPRSSSLFIERKICRWPTGGAAVGDSAERPSTSSLRTVTRGAERRGAPFLPKPYRPICNALCPDSLSPGRLLSGARGREGTRQQGRTDMEGTAPTTIFDFLS